MAKDNIPTIEHAPVHEPEPPCSGCAENARLAREAQREVQTQRLAFITSLTEQAAAQQVNLTLIDAQTPYGGGNYLRINSFATPDSGDGESQLSTRARQFGEALKSALES